VSITRLLASVILRTLYTPTKASRTSTPVARIVNSSVAITPEVLKLAEALLNVPDKTEPPILTTVPSDNSATRNLVLTPKTIELSVGIFILGSCSKVSSVSETTSTIS